MDDFGLLVGRHLTTLPTLSNEQPSELQLDSSGRLILASRFLAGTDSYASGDSLLSMGAVRSDAEGPLTGIADGEYSPLQVDANGRLKVATVVSVDPSDAEYAHSSAFTAGQTGIFTMAVVQATLAQTAGIADGDHGELKTNLKGELYVKDTDALSKLTDIETTINDGIDVVVAAPGTEAYSVTDSLAIAGDGLESITAAGTPWVTVASISVGAGQTAYVYGWQFACDQNCQARLMTDDQTNEIVYKTDVNSSAMPGVREHFSSEGRIEIPGSATTELRIEMKKRATSGGNANGTGSIHVRLV